MKNTIIKMKKIFIYILVLFAILPCYAEINLNIFQKNKAPDTYSLQKQKEAEFAHNLIQTPVLAIFMDMNYLIREDIDSYYNNQDSSYGYIVNLLKDCQNSKTQCSNADLKYLEILKSSWETAYKYNNTPNKIIIQNDEYSTLSENLIKQIAFYNFMFYADKTPYIPSVIPIVEKEVKELETDFINHKNNLSSLIKYYKKLKEAEEKYKRINSPYLYQMGPWGDRLFKLVGEVRKYGYNFEKKTYMDWAKQNNKKLICGRLYQFIYSSAYTPKQGCLYEHVPQGDYTIQTLQSINGGVILTGDYRIGNGVYNINNIFLQTTKSFADGQYIAEPIIAEYKGYYDYYTVLGAKSRIYKFYRLGQNEIDKNFNMPGQFYFYQPY